MLCFAAQHDPIGYVAIDGEGLAADDIAHMVGIDSSQASTLIGELERNGVLSRDRKGTIYSRRMVRDAKRSKLAAQNGKKGGNPSLYKNKTIPPPDNQQLKGTLNTHKPITINQTNDREPKEANCNLASVLDRLIAAANGNVVHGAFGIEVIQPILDLQALGCDLESDILPAIGEVVPKLDKPLRTWGARFLRDACLARQAARLRSRGKTAIPDEQKWRNWWKIYKETGAWLVEAWGDPPTSPACKIPRHLIEEWSCTE